MPLSFEAGEIDESVDVNTKSLVRRIKYIIIEMIVNNEY